MLDSQSSEPGFESLFVTVSKIGHFRSLHWCSSWLSCINEYLAIDSGGNVSDLVVARNCCMARMLPGEAELVSEWTGLPGRAKSVKRFEWSNRPDIALYKNYLYLFWVTPQFYRNSALEMDCLVFVLHFLLEWLHIYHHTCLYLIVFTCFVWWPLKEQLFC